MHWSCLFRLSVPAIYPTCLEQAITASRTICSEYPDFFHKSELGGVALPKLRVEHPETANKVNTNKKPHIHLAFIVRPFAEFFELNQEALVQEHLSVRGPTRYPCDL